MHLWTFRCGKIIFLAIIFLLQQLDYCKILSLLFACKLSFSIEGLKVISLHNFALKSSNRIFILYLENCYNTGASSS
jgi:hypothetical protein